MTEPIKITIIPSGATLEVFPGESIFEVLIKAGVGLNSYCGGQGICGKCRVRLSKNVPIPTELERAHLSAEEIKEGIRLACGLYPGINMEVEITEPVSASEYKLKIEELSFPLDPWRECPAEGLVLAVDFGTTNAVGHLLDPLTGKIIASATIVNSQSILGADVMTRLTYSSQNGHEARETFKGLAFSDIEKLAELTAANGKNVTDVIAVMNTAIETLMLGLSPDNLGRYPYESGIEGPAHVSPFENGPLRGATIHIPPVIGGFVGSDTVSVLLAVSALDQAPPYLILDIGTNAEVVVVTKETIVACSTAAGPAFEGMGIRNGMRGIEGAIEKVRFCEGTLKITVIGDKSAAGITGSGLFSLVSELFRSGALDQFGAVNPERIPEHLIRQSKSGWEIILASDVTVSEDDIQQFILAKAATRAAVDTALSFLDVKANELNAILIAGTFANRIDPLDILTVGLLPPLEVQRLLNVGNAASTGAVMMALSKSVFQQSCFLAGNIKHLTLSGNKTFKETFQSQVCLGNAGSG